MSHRTVFSCILALLASSPLLAAAQISAHAEAGGPNALRVLENRGVWTLQQGARVSALPLSAHTRVTSVAQVGAGWLVAGSRSDGSGGEDLFLLHGGAAASTRELHVPAKRLGPIAASPVLLQSAGALRGVAWLEGALPARFAIRFAAWDGTQLGAATTVAPPGPGSQLALTGTTLSDGRTLLVWAGFDGHDDEIWASVGGRAGWSQPARVAPDDSVPDITPTVLATSDGALVTWSRYDGSEYRLMAARFDGKTFLDPHFVGPPGSLFPSYEDASGTPLLLYRDARSGSWVAAQVSSRGDLTRATRLSGDSSDRPMIHTNTAGVTWEFAGRSVTTPWK